MKKPIITFLLLCYSLFVCSQSDSLKRAKIDSIYNTKAIRFYTQQIYSTTVYKNASTNAPMGSATSRSLKFNFQVGDDRIINIGRKSKNLREAIKDDPEAIAELNKAYKVHLRKKRINNTLEYVSYFVAFGSIVPLFIGADRDVDKVNALSVGGGIGVVAGWAGIYYFKYRTDKHMDNFSASLSRSVQIYNANIYKKLMNQ